MSEDTIAELRKMFRYDPETGKLYKRWVQTRWGMRYIPEIECGSIASHGYLQVRHNQEAYLVHRLGWFLTYGTWPNLIDHINRIKLDNRLCNLKDCNQEINQHNRHNSSLSGVSLRCTRKGEFKFDARITVRKKTIYLGVFPSEDAALAAVQSARMEMLNV